MEKKGIINRTLAILGFFLVWLTVLAPVFFSIISLVSGGGFNFDYLMPAELFIPAMAGGIALLWAALRTHSQVKWISWTLIAVVITVVGGQVLAMVTGLAQGEAGSEGWLPLVIGMIILYDLLLVVLGVGGYFLLRGLTRKKV